MAPKDTSYLDVAHQRALEKKTHVSFPQLKYPSLRDEGTKHPVQWLEGKAMDDGAEGLWRVHDKLYDVKDFINKHPGGAEWLELSEGTDITEAFECHHLGVSAYKILEKYYVRDAISPRNSPFTFEEDGFYKTLKGRVVEALKTVPKDTHKASDRIIDSLLATCLISSALALWFENAWLVNAAYLVASTSLCWIVISSHNYIHRKTNWRMYLFNMGCWSYRDFRVSHALSHHLYPNTLMDLEISAFEPIVWWNPRRDKPRHTYISFMLQLLIFPFSFLLNFTNRFICNFTREGFFNKHYRWHDAVGFLLPIWMYVVTGVSFSEALYMWLWIVCTASAMFFHTGSNAAHHHPKIFKDGDEIRNVTPDWGMHELEAVMDRKEINSSLFLIMTFFGNHSLHHLFPTLDHAVLSHLYPVFLKTCKQFRANFRESNQLDLFIGQLQMAIKREPNLLDDDS